MPTHTFTAPAGHSFRVNVRGSSYSVALMHGAKRVEWSGRHWGPSMCDALSRACYTGEPLHAASAIRFLFGRIDGYVNRPGLLDLWAAATMDAERLDVDRLNRLESAVRSAARPNLDLGGCHVEASPRLEADAGVPFGTLARLIEFGRVVRTGDRLTVPSPLAA